MGIFNQHPELRSAHELPPAWLIRTKKIGLLVIWLASMGITVVGGALNPQTLWLTIPTMIALSAILRSKDGDYAEQLFIKREGRKKD